MSSQSKFLSLIPSIFFFLGCFQTFLYSSDYKLVLLTSDRGILVSEDSGQSWDTLGAGLPRGVVPQTIQSDRNGNLFLTTTASGIFRFDKSKGHWEDINSELFFSPFPASKAKEYRKISAITLNKDNDTIVAATKHSIYRKEKDKPWTKLIGYPSENYCTALALSKNAVYAGTSYNGLFRMQDSHAYNISSNLPREQYSKKYSFYEEIAAIDFGGKDANNIYAGLNFGGGVFVSLNGGASWKPLNFPASKDTLYSIFDIKADGDSLFVSSDAGIYKMDKLYKWHSLQLEDLLRRLSIKKENLSVLITDSAKNYPTLFFRLNDYRKKKDSVLADKARSRKAFYVNAYSLNKNLQSYMDTIKKCGLNAIVIDVKDDWGDICFSSGNKTASEIGAVKKYFDIKIIDSLKKNGIYTIARIVVFKDKRLYSAYKSKYAIRDKESAVPWKGNPREYWTDPYSDFVRNYNIEIAEEVQLAGFDEIQFDYIRFPSDGPIDRCHYTFKKTEDIYKSEILAFFLEEAKSRIKLPLSVDIYGFNAWFHMGNRIGQDAERFSEVVDIICPMVYPSHYGRSFFADMTDSAKPYKIVLESAKRSRKITMDNAVIRPYLQAFNLLSPTWGPNYIKSQTKAALEGGYDGYTFWNASGNYDMVKKATADRTGK
jgi:hypothetical protein